ncbi:MAG: FAD-dependent monooxygenase [Proteobacteria bacterium]|nr:FAD-dependent monooxygenase [Pseudomonadota bacterium]
MTSKATASTAARSAGITETDVLIVGAGPVGAALAIELGLRGIRVHLVEQVPEIGSWWTRAMNANKRTMEHLRRWGVAQSLKDINYVPKDWPGNVTLVQTLGGSAITCVRGEGLGWHRVLDDSAEDSLWVAQGQMQQVLLRRARELGAVIEMRAQATAIEEGEAGEGGPVRVQVRQDGAERWFHARYVVGCDGARSFVRESAGLSYQGGGVLSRVIALFFDAPGLLDDMRRRGIPDSVMYLCAQPQVRGLARLVQGSRWELQVNLLEDQTADGVDPEALVRLAIGPDIAFTFERSFPFSYYDLIADRYGRRHVFIAGDATHIIPPLGGHNLNLGVGDAVNLGWKLAHVLRGWAGDELLDSYTPERRGMALRTKGEVLANHDRLFSTFALLAQWLAIEGDDDAAQARRKRMGEDIGVHLRPQWRNDGIVLDQRYTGSPIVAAAEAPAREIPYDPQRNIAWCAPGHRAPMHRDAQGTALYDRFGAEYTLLDIGSGSAGMQAMRQLLAAGWPVKHLPIDDPELRNRYGCALALIRPDQHVAWCGEQFPSDAQALLDRLAGRARVAQPLAA